MSSQIKFPPRLSSSTSFTAKPQQHDPVSVNSSVQHYIKHTLQLGDEAPAPVHP